MVQVVKTFALTATIALAGCLGPAPGSDEWVAIQEAKSAEFLRQCNADGATNCSYTYSYTKADNWFDHFLNALGDASSPRTQGSATHSPNATRQPTTRIWYSSVGAQEWESILSPAPVSAQAEAEQAHTTFIMTSKRHFQPHHRPVMRSCAVGVGV
jgi:hypothetical protein